MDKLEFYRNKIKELISEYASYQYAYGEIESQAIFDTEHDHYQLVRMGWEGKKRVYGCVMHFDIKDSKIWIQCNFTDVDIAKELMDLGVSREDIVLGFHPAYLRPYTDYAVG